MTDLTLTDGIAVAVARLKGDSTVLSAYGSAGAVSGVVEPPYPHLLVTAGPSTIDQPGWRLTQDIDLAAYADRQNDPGDAELRRLLTIGVESLRQLPAVGVADDTETIVTYVEVITGPQPLHEVGGYQRWIAGLRLHLHPARAG